jgi:hypothetical protein
VVNIPKKCVEIECRNDGRYRIVTVDNSTLYVCEEHLGSWIDSGCSLAEKTLKKVLGLIMKYGIYSGFLVAGFSLTLYMVVTWIGRYGISPYILEIWLGLAFIIISWIISLANIRRATQKVRTR